MGPKTPYLGSFGLEFEKAIVVSEISTFKFLKNEPLTHTVNFGIGSAFSKGPGPGPLYKLCPLTGAQLGWRGVVYPALSENRKKGLDFWKKGLNCNHL